MGKNQIITNINNIFVGKPFLINISKNDQWEKAWKINRSQSLPSDQKIESYLENEPFTSLAIEVWFKDKYNETTIFGMGYSQKFKVKNEAEFLKIIIEESFEYKNFILFINNLSKIFTESNDFFFQTNPDLIRIGVVDHWFSVGPCLIWENSSQPTLSLKEVKERLKNRPELVSTPLNFISVAYVYKSESGYYYIKPQCSKKQGNLYLLDCQKIITSAQKLFGFKIIDNTI